MEQSELTGRPKKRQKMEFGFLGSRVVGLTGLDSHSTSFTDIWKLEFQDGSKSFLKIWIHPDIDKSESCAGLMYEAEFYKTIVNSIECPHFVVSRGFFPLVTFQDLLELLLEGTQNQFLVKENLIENIDTMSSKQAGRLSVTRNNNERVFTVCPDGFREEVCGYSFCALLTQDVEGVSLDQWTSAFLNKPEFMQVLFQVLIAIQSLQTRNAKHGDLHCQNVIVKSIEPVVVSYKIFDQVFTFKQTIKVFLFDFDLAWCSDLGPNIIHTLCPIRDDLSFFVDALLINLKIIKHTKQKSLIGELNKFVKHMFQVPNYRSKKYLITVPVKDSILHVASHLDTFPEHVATSHYEIN